MLNQTKEQQNSPPKTVRNGFKVVPPPKDAERRAMLAEPDIGGSGGCRTVNHQPAH